MIDRLCRFLCLILLLIIFPLLPASAGVGHSKPAPLSGTVTWIYDADTFEIAPHGKVRLLGIDAPEQAGSERDRDFTRLDIAASQLRVVHGAGLGWCIHNIKGRQVVLTFDETPRDRHGRLLAYVHLPDGQLLNRLLLERGLVIVYRRFSFSLKNDFLVAEAKARQEELGLWSH